VWWLNTRAAKNYIVTEKPIDPNNPPPAPVKPAEGGDSAAEAPASPSAAASSSGGDSAPAAAEASESKETEGEEGGKKVDDRVWLPDEHSTTCMNPECGADFTFTKRRTHCRHCGQIFCGKCTSQKIDDQKLCAPCHKLRSEAVDKSALPALLERPKIKIRQLNFHRYNVSLHESEKFALAGASSAAAQAALPGSEGKFLIVLTHKRPTRPQLTVAFTDKDERDKWLGLLSAGSKFGPSPITQDPILKKAFTQAYNKTRWHCWLWGHWDVDGTEAEMLTDCIYDTLEREIFGKELHALKAGFARDMLRKALTGVIHSGVNVAWSALMAGLAGIRGPLETKAAEILQPIFEVEIKVKDSIKAPLEEGAQKGLAKAETTLQEQFQSHLPVVAAAAEAEVGDAVAHIPFVLPFCVDVGRLR
jgi:hypothetical protein